MFESVVQFLRFVRLHTVPGPVLYFLGDSHLAPAKHAYRSGWMEPWKCRFKSVGGATAVGLRHPTSKTQALEKFRSLMLPYNPNFIPVLQLGEVDCGFVIWHRAKKYGEEVDTQLVASIEAYSNFIRELRHAGYKYVIVTSAMLPTIGDGDFKGEVALLRRDIGATQSERTKLTQRYNNLLMKVTADAGAHFVNFTPLLIDQSTGLIRTEFKHPKENDHHLHPEKGGYMWSRAIETKLAELGIGPRRKLQ